MASQKWESLTLEKQLIIITSDIEDLLREINSLTAPGGEVDEALNAALDSFIPLMSAYKIDDLHNFEVSSEGEEAENVNPENSPRQHNRQNGSAVKKTLNEVQAGESYERSNTRKGHGMLSNSGVRSTTRARNTLESKFVKPEPSEQTQRGRVVRKSRMRGTKESVDESVYESLTHYVNLRESNQEDGDASEVI